MPDDLRPKVSSLESIEKLTMKLRAAIDSGDAFKHIAETVREVTGADFGFVLLVEKDNPMLSVLGEAGDTASFTGTRRIPLDEETLKKLSQGPGSSAMRTERDDLMPLETRQYAAAGGISTILTSSIMLRGECIGFLIAGMKANDLPFVPGVEQELARVADNIAFAIDNFRKSLLLSRSIEETERILSMAPIGIMSIDPKGIITAVNNQMTRVLERKTSEELVGTSVFEMPAISRSGLDALLMQGMEGHDAEKTEVHFVPKLDKAYYLHVKVTPLMSVRDEVEQVLLVAMDTSSKVRLENQLERSYEKLTQTYQELERVNKMKSQFIDVVSHELRTPLTVMRGYVDLMDSEYSSKMDPKFSQRVRTIKANTDKLYALVESMLDVSRLEKGSLEIHPEPVRLDVILEELVKIIMPEAHGKKQTLTLDVEGKLPLVMADRRRMKDVFNNIIDNAIKYTQEGGRIQVGARDEGKIIHVWVRDNGVGIPLENLGRIFDRFYIVASNALAHQVNRIGLSLPISKGIIEAHSGRIWVESQVGKGSVFHIDLPKELPK